MSKKGKTSRVTAPLKGQETILVNLILALYGFFYLLNSYNSYLFHPWKEQNLAGFPLSAASLLIRENGGGGLGGAGGVPWW